MRPPATPVPVRRTFRRLAMITGVSVVAAIAVAMPAGGPASAQTLQSKRDVTNAAVVARRFFNAVAARNYAMAMAQLDVVTTQKYQPTYTRKTLEAHSAYLAGTAIQPRFAYVARPKPIEIVSCLQATAKPYRKLYLSARMVARAGGANGWRVQTFKINSFPETGCPA